METWKDIASYEGLYQVSNLGRVRSVDRKVTRRRKNGKEFLMILGGRVMKPHISDRGYYRLKLSKNGKEKTFKIHKLVAIAFVDNPENFCEVNHKDGNKLNNCCDNLEWCTRSHNVRHAVKLGLLRGSIKMKVG